jgi:chromosome segregation ATPase
MADDTNVLDFLRKRFARLDERLDRSDSKLAEIIFGVGATETGQASLRRDYAELNANVAHLSVRLDHVADRLERIERRLDLADEMTRPLFSRRWSFSPCQEPWPATPPSGAAAAGPPAAR